MDTTTLLIYLLTGVIGYVSYLIGKGTREQVIATTVEYLIDKGYLKTDEKGDIKVIN